MTCLCPLKGFKKTHTHKEQNKERLQREGMEVMGERGEDMGSDLMGWEKLCRDGIQGRREHRATQYHLPFSFFLSLSFSFFFLTEITPGLSARKCPKPSVKIANPLFIPQHRGAVLCSSKWLTGIFWGIYGLKPNQELGQLQVCDTVLRAIARN